MEIVVKIPDDTIKSLEQGNFGAKYNIYDLVGYLMNGTPLPKHHGRLIDEEDIALIDEQFYVPSDYYVAESAINDAPTIIEGSDNE